MEVEMPWKKGQSGNPSGRPKVDKTIQELARSHGPEAIATLAKIMRDPKSPPQARAMASERLLDRGYGKPPQFNTGQTSEFRRAVDMTDDELAAIVAAGRGKVLELVKPVAPTLPQTGTDPVTN
jgi:hypothetical protein